MSAAETDSEMLREALTHMEILRQREADLRQESETLFETLLDLLGTRDRNQLYSKLMDRLREMVPYESVFILRMAKPGVFVPNRHAPPEFQNTTWAIGAFLERVLSGRPLVAHEPALIEEWQKALSPEVLKLVGCALHVPIISPYRQGVLICTHSKRGAFGRNHARLAERFYPLVSQVMLQLDMHTEMTRRERLFHLNPNLLAVLNEAGMFIESNGAWTDQLGLTSADLLRMKLVDLVAEADRPKVREIMASLKSGDNRREQLVLPDQNGQHRTYMCVCARDEEGNYYWSGQDITEAHSTSGAHERKL